MMAADGAGLTPDEQARFDSLYGAQQSAAEPSGAGAFAGAYKGLAGIPSGATGAVLSIADAATAPPDNKDDENAMTPFGIVASAFHPTIDQLRQDTAEYYRPDPQTTGFVGNTLFGAADVLTRVGVGNLVAPGSGLAVAAGTTGYERTKQLEAQGVDPSTAETSGYLTGVSLLAMGGVTSAFGKTTLQRVITGAGTNIAFGATTRGLDSALLDANGYHAQAEQQKWSDGASILADAIIGGAFHLLPHSGIEQAKPADTAPAAPIPADVVDSALTAKSAQNITDLAPGVPADPRSASAHVDALDTAQSQLMDGKDVTVDPIVRDATFVPRPGEMEITTARTLPEVGAVIDARLSALDDLAQGERTKADLELLGNEAGDLEDTLRQQYGARDNNVQQAPENRLTADEMAFAENRLAKIKTELEAHRQALAARNEAVRLRDRLSRADTDPELRAIADQLHPEPRVPVDADRVLREAMAHEGILPEQLAVEAAPEVAPQVVSVETSPDATHPKADAGTAGAPADAGRSKQRAAGADAKAEQRTGLDPARIGEVERARQAVAERPDLVLDDGTTVADALRSADAEHTQAVKTSDAVKAAVACFLRFGADA